jgi:uncharacterized membrane protein
VGLNWAEHSTEIEAPIEICFNAIVDYETFPRWQNAVDSVEVLDRHQDGLARNVKLFVDAKVRKIDYTLDYSYERPHRIEWDFVSGNGMRGVDGHYTFDELGPERTKATYKLGADPAIPVPGIVAKRVHKELVKRSVEDLKREAEARHVAAATATTAGIPSEPPAEPKLEPEDIDAPPDLDQRRFGDSFRRERQFEPAPERRETVREEPPLLLESGSRSIVERARSVATDPVRAARGAARLGVKTARTAAEIGVETVRSVVRQVDRRLTGDSDRER